MSFVKYLAKFVGTLVLAWVYVQLIGVALGLIGLGHYIQSLWVTQDSSGNYNAVIENQYYWLLWGPIILISIWLAFKTTKIPPYGWFK
tara:strand:- start:951 stop:1214 length:264 start_codon:yes stop_codon:yes gene_type:complete